MKGDSSDLWQKLDVAWQFAQRKPAVAAVLLLLINFPILKWLLRRVAQRAVMRVQAKKNPLFSLPTICSELPSLGRSPLKRTEGEVAISPDDWCQAEFVHSDNRARVEKVLARIKANAPVGQGPSGYAIFKECVSRPAWDVSFERAGLTLDELRDGLKSPNPRSLYLWESATGASVYQIEGGFVIPIPSGGHLYGVAFHGQVVKLGCLADGMSSDSLYELALVTKLRSTLLVDWLHGRIIQIGANH